MNSIFYKASEKLNNIMTRSISKNITQFGMYKKLFYVLNFLMNNFNMKSMVNI